MRWRNGAHGYGLVTKILHWLTVLAIAAQFTVGWSMDTDGAFEDRLDRREEQAERQGEAAEERFEAEEDRLEGTAEDTEYDVFTGVLDSPLADGLSLPEVHVLLGLLVLALALLRVVWRRTTALPPWATQLTATDRRWLHASEVALLTMVFVVPLSGIALALGGTDDLVPMHVAAHVAFLLALAGHLGVVFHRRLTTRML